MTQTKFKKRLVTVAVASCLSFAPWLVEAASLGKITVLSGIGQPLRAEIELSATRAELAGMSARMAPSSAFKEAGVDFAPALVNLRFDIGKRSNGTPIVKVSSAQPINDPFIDMLVELNWPSGPLLREYTFLLDPPEMVAKAGRQAPVTNARVVDTTRASAAAPIPRAEQPATTAPLRKPQESGTRVVERGDTLRRIAGETKHDGVSLEQMMVGLYKKNPDAFVGDNMNRMKAGAILNIPDKATVAAVPAAEARQLYVAQVADWNAYRQKLAAAPGEARAEPDAGPQSAAGKIAPKVEDKPSAVDKAKDKVKVSSAEMVAKGVAAGKVAAVEEELIAKDMALKEAQDRLAALEKNVVELQKLVDMKTQRLAELQQQVSGQPVAPVEPPKLAEPPKAQEPAVTEPPKAAEEPKSVEPPKAAEEPKPAEPPKAVEAPKPAVPVAQPKPVPAPAPEPGFVDQLLGDPLPLIGGGGILALLAGYFLLRRRRSDAEPEFTAAVPAPSSLGPNSVFRMTGGQSVDTGNIPLQTGDFSQTGPGTIDTDEVDPVAEADVYMAYGRDAQAEEILIEALRKDPHRTAIHAKLLEIYANRKSVKQFDTLASELYGQTGGVGAEWEKVAAMGAALDPENPLYSGGQGQGLAAPVAGEPAPAPDEVAAGKATVVLPGKLGQMAAGAVGAALVVESSATGTVQDEVPRLPEASDADVAESEGSSQTAAGSDDSALNFDLGGVGRQFAPEVTQLAEVVGEMEMPEIEAIDFDLGGIPQDALTATEANPELLPTDTQVAGVSDQESRLTETFIGLEAPGGTGEEQPQSVAGAIDLELGDSASGTETLVDPGVLHEAVSVESPEVGAETIVNSLDFAEPGHGELTVTDGSAGLASEFDPNEAEYDINLGESIFIGNPMPSPEFDIASINLDLGADAAEPTQVVGLSETVIAGNAAGDPGFEEGSTKLALAKAYEEMGDLDQARELLQEVIDEGSGDLVDQAREIIGRLRG
jgi:pilus assembly protein FimV